MAASSKNPPCSHEDINSIFLNSETVLFLHQIFLKGLTARMDSWPTLVLGTSLGAIIIHFLRAKLTCVWVFPFSIDNKQPAAVAAFHQRSENFRIGLVEQAGQIGNFVFLKLTIMNFFSSINFKKKCCN